MTTFHGTCGGVLVVGEAPNKASWLSDMEGTNALEIPRLASLCGISMDAFLGLFVRVNLLDEWPGRAVGGKGDFFPRPLAVEGAKKIKGTFFPLCWVDMIVLLGRRVQDAFLDIEGRRPPEWFVAEKKNFSWEGQMTTRLIDVVTVPHPSGVSSWWTNPKNVEKTSAFWANACNVAMRHLIAIGPDPESKNPFLQEVTQMFRDDYLERNRDLLIPCIINKARNQSFDWKQFKEWWITRD